MYHTKFYSLKLLCLSKNKFFSTIIWRRHWLLFVRFTWYTNWHYGEAVVGDNISEEVIGLPLGDVKAASTNFMAHPIDDSKLHSNEVMPCTYFDISLRSLTVFVIETKAVAITK